MSFVTQVSANPISVRVTNIDINKSGNIMAMLFTEDGFPKEHHKAIDTQIKKADSAELIFSFNVTSDTFSVKILHDENEDGKTSKNWTTSPNVVDIFDD